MRLRFSVPIVLLLTTTALPGASAAETPETTSTRIALRDAPMNRDATREVHPGGVFDLVGITWRGPAPDRVEVRTRSAAGWSPWSELEAIDAAQGSEPLWTGRADTAEVRASRAGADVTGELELVAINPGSAPAAPPRSSAPGQPPVVGRAQWGADESQMTWPPERTETKAVVVHHTAGTNDYDCGRSADIVRAIYRYHAVELKWGDIGYHALVDKCGTIFEGRAGGLRDDIIGGHARGFNGGTFGVSMMGNYDRIAPSGATIESVAAISAWKLNTARIPADGRIELIAGPANNSHFPPGAAVPLPTIFGHRDVSKTACPGQRGYEQLDKIRARATAMQRDYRP
ncbi:N-acetylmuramoyl-L-alanine amidase [Saccharopolyspora pogona]|uniref:N-acetylmuramoyl-L-alanine amidase n=1 Tax=Saccharopolyspora pogona TaxID=333966 RepID=UPI001684FFEC|nr:N-acetylmuramoyl-L-alanine amidase [Saccharopolyspora pogona]